MAVVESPAMSLLPHAFLRREPLVTPSSEAEPAAVRTVLGPNDLLIFKVRRLKMCVDGTALAQNKK